MTLTRTAIDVVSILTSAVRVMSDIQVGRTWFATTASPASNARRLLGKLEAEGLVQLYRAPAHPEIWLLRPVVSWWPGERPPDLAHAGYVLNRRWTEPPVLTTCVCATRRARNLFYGRGRRPREVELTHDLHMAAVYLNLRRSDSVSAMHWISEEQIRRERGHLDERLPDAIVRVPGRPPLIVEFGGAYKKAKLEAFHDYCSSAALAYEVW